MSLDLNQLSLKPLRDTQSTAERIIASLSERRKREAPKALEAAVLPIVFSLADPGRSKKMQTGGGEICAP